MNTDPARNPHPKDFAPESIAKLLTDAAAQLDPGTMTALHHARNAALAKQSLRKPVLALSGEHGATHRLIPHSAQQWAVVTTLLVAVLVSVAGYWHHGREHDTNHHDMSHLDIAILTDDMPMDVFVD